MWWPPGYVCWFIVPLSSGKKNINPTVVFANLASFHHSKKTLFFPKHEGVQKTMVKYPFYISPMAPTPHSRTVFPAIFIVGQARTAKTTGLRRRGMSVGTSWFHPFGDIKNVGLYTHNG